MQVIGDKNQISEDVFNFRISYLLHPSKSIRSEFAKLFSISIFAVSVLGQTRLGYSCCNHSMISLCKVKKKHNWKRFEWQHKD